MNRKDLVDKLIKLQKHDEIAIKTKENKYEIVKTAELEVTRLPHTFINGTKYKNIVDDCTSAFYVHVIAWTVAEHNGFNSYIIEATDNYDEDVLHYGIVYNDLINFRENYSPEAKLEQI